MTSYLVTQVDYFIEKTRPKSVEISENILTARISPFA